MTTPPSSALRAAQGALAALPVRPGAPRLPDTEIAARLETLPEWRIVDAGLVRSFGFTGYAQTIAFVNAVAWIAERLDHHPDLRVGYGRCEVRWTTHDAGGLTQNDFVAAARVELLLS